MSESVTRTRRRSRRHGHGRSLAPPIDVFVFDVDGRSRSPPPPRIRRRRQSARRARRRRRPRRTHRIRSLRRRIRRSFASTDRESRHRFIFRRRSLSERALARFVIFTHTPSRGPPPTVDSSFNRNVRDARCAFVDVSDGTVPTETPVSASRDWRRECPTHRVARAHAAESSRPRRMQTASSRASPTSAPSHIRRASPLARRRPHDRRHPISPPCAPETPPSSRISSSSAVDTRMYVLKSLAMNPCEGARVTLIAKDLHTPYSGIPGLVAGHYSWEETHVDLEPICRSGNFRIIHDEAVGIDHANKRVLMRSGRPGVRFGRVQRRRGHTTPPRRTWRAERTRDAGETDLWIQREVGGDVGASARGWEKCDVCVVGGGAGRRRSRCRCGHRMREELKSAVWMRLSRVHARDAREVMPSHAKGVRKTFLKVFDEAGVRVIEDDGVARAESKRWCFRVDARSTRTSASGARKRARRSG